MPSRLITDLDPRFQAIAQKAMEAFEKNDLGYEVHLTATLRSFEEQDALFAMGRTAPGEIVTKAVGGMSWHNYGLAFDVAPFIGGKPAWQYKTGGIWDRLGFIGKSFGLYWGGDWRKPDRPHFEWHPGYRVIDVRIAKQRWDAGQRPIPLEV